MDVIMASVRTDFVSKVFKVSCLPTSERAHAWAAAERILDSSIAPVWSKTRLHFAAIGYTNRLLTA